MSKITVTLPDGSSREYEKGVKLYDVCKDISEVLLRDVLGAVVNGTTMGLQETLEEDSKVKFVKFEDKEGKAIFWHTSAHLMAYAIQRLYKDVKFAIGPSIDDGFYYDFDTEHRFVPEDFEKIEKEMTAIVKEGGILERYEMPRNEAIEHFKKLGEKYKVELIEDLPEDAHISFYKLGDFVDLCKGPHLYDISKIKAFKLLSIAGAYWRGDEHNEMLQRIYAVSFPKKKMLDEHLARLEEAKLRDHRKIGKEMDLFSMHDEGPGFPFFHPNGMVVRNELLSWWRDVLAKNGYGEILTPIILNEDLWHRSGHWDHYKENMYFTKIDDKDYAIKPMNCPGSTIVYANSQHSYKELPIRLSEFGQVHRHELSGTLHGLFRVRTFTQDDAHVYCLPSQVEDEVFKMIDLADYLYSTFGFKYTIELSTRPDDYMGDLEAWNLAEKSLKEALEETLEQLGGDGGSNKLLTSVISAANSYIAKDYTQAAEDLLDVEVSSLPSSEAKDLYNTIAEETMQSASTELYSRARTAYNKSDYTEAAEYFVKAYKCDTTMVDAVYYAAKCYDSLGQEDNAVKYYQYIVDDFPSSSYYREANSYVNSH